MLLHRVDRRFGLLKRFAACFRDHRRPELIKHPVEELVRQRVYGIACGYEDLVDHASLRSDPLLAAVVGKAEPTEEPLASPSTLNRLELTLADATAKSRYRKVVYDTEAIEDFFVDAFLDAHQKAPKELVLDLDATDDPIHGTQEGRFFHGYYGNYCYLPLYIFAGDFLLSAKLRTSDIDASAGALDEVKRLVARIRARWPNVKLMLRADSGFARDELMSWCEDNGVDYVFGLARNDRLVARIGVALEEVRQRAEKTGKPVRLFRELRYRTLKSWSRSRRVVAKAEQLGDKSNPRFVVTSFPARVHRARHLYEGLYCARGDMENRIKEQQLALFADRTSAHTMRANQLRLWFASVAYVLLNLLRHFGLKGTELERAQAGTIRTRLLKIGAVVRVSVRRVVLSLSAASPVRELFARIAELLRANMPTPS
jgi:Transposase DDE domain group 1